MGVTMTSQSPDDVQVCSLLAMSTAENFGVGKKTQLMDWKWQSICRKLRFGNWPRTTYRMEPTAPVGAIKNCVEWPGSFCDEHSIVINMVLSALTFNLHHPRGGSNVAHKGVITWENIAKIKTSFANLSFKTGGSYQSQIPPKNPCMFAFFFYFAE